MTIWNSVVGYRRWKLAIMWSGGMDTTIAYFYAVKNGYSPKEIVMIHLDLGHPYEWKEKKAIEMLLPYIKADYLHFKIDLLRKELGNLPTPEKQVIPARNSLISWLGAFFADRVWICALDGEMHRFMPDKNHTFFTLTSGYLSYVFDKDITIETPFARMSKTELARWFVDNYGKEFAEEVLEKTVTCYDEKEWACGECSTCFKRWIAYVNAGLDWRKYWKDKKPWESKEAKKLIEKYKKALEEKDFSHYSEKRIFETIFALKKIGIKWQ